MTSMSPSHLFPHGMAAKAQPKTKPRVRRLPTPRRRLLDCCREESRPCASRSVLHSAPCTLACSLMCGRAWKPRSTLAASRSPSCLWARRPSSCTRWWQNPLKKSIQSYLREGDYESSCYLNTGAAVSGLDSYRVLKDKDTKRCSLQVCLDRKSTRLN